MINYQLPINELTNDEFLQGKRRSRAPEPETRNPEPPTSNQQPATSNQ